MHPEICRFPSMHFYDNKLLNGVDMSSKSAPFHESHHLGPYVFYDIVDGQEQRSGDSSSVCNEQEAEAAVQLLRFFKKRSLIILSYLFTHVLESYMILLSSLASLMLTGTPPNLLLEELAL